MFSQAEELFERISQDNEVLRVFKFHSYRVMHFASLLAEEVQCLDEDMRVASLLHDIGKMGLSKDILLKPAKLDPLEFEIIKAHSHIGNNILRKTLNAPRAALFVRDHHERWDGKGYPRGLSGEQISLQGRIISICDAFDTMTIDRRNYDKQTLTFEKAFEELRNCSWGQFDGDLVEAFITVIGKLQLSDPSLWFDKLDKIEEVLSPQAKKS
ncbi:HD-GYP domain-containing protein [Salinibacillus xinjiangensis]|uniref:HD domain-containing protein n=1 Tax=Salinibacillus xinjiangensis TaxID=1229268 RepID=A0A6G1X7D7_9BACI|nr:HD domain-containing phosphohydrolase [Salinibacillus xinjiangensis]MRG86790.1 HD domain-containing protein [Salinibacillus xinjiangensis]